MKNLKNNNLIYLGDKADNGQKNGFALIDIYQRDVYKIINTIDDEISSLCYNPKNNLLFASMEICNGKFKSDFRTKIYQLINNDNLMVEDFQANEEHSNNIYDRLTYIIKKAESTGLVGIDLISYIIMLSKEVYSEEERNNIFKLTIVRNNNSLENGFGENNDYYLYSFDTGLVQISQKDLQERFNNFQLSYVNNDSHSIPDIVNFNNYSRIRDCLK